MHASAHACVFTHISVYVYACILSQDYMCICTMCIHSRLCMCMHVFSHRITCVYVCMCVFTLMIVCVHVHIYPLTYLEHKAWDPICRAFSLPHTPKACPTRITNKSDHLLDCCLISGTTISKKGFTLAHGLSRCSPSWWGGHAVWRGCVCECESACSHSCRSEAEAGSGARH